MNNVLKMTRNLKGVLKFVSFLTSIFFIDLEAPLNFLIDSTANLKVKIIER
jgi:hypothetical protein